MLKRETQTPYPDAETYILTMKRSVYLNISSIFTYTDMEVFH